MAFDWPSSIIELFLSSNKAHLPYGAAAKSNFGLSNVVLPVTLPHRESLEDGKLFGIASTSHADCDLAEPQVVDEEEKEGCNSGKEQRMDSDLADSDLDELDNNSTSGERMDSGLADSDHGELDNNSTYGQRMDSPIGDSDLDELDINSTSDCPEANDALVIQIFLKSHPTCKGCVMVLNQCCIMISTDLVLWVLSRYKNDKKIAVFFFVWVSPGYSHGAGTYNAMLNTLGRIKQF